MVNGDVALQREAEQAYEDSERVLGLRGLYYELVRRGPLLNQEDEWARYVHAVYASPLATFFRWKPLAPGAKVPEPDLS